MPKKRWVKRVLIGIATMVGAIALLIAVGVWYVRSHSVPQISLDTTEGRIVLQRSTSPDYEPLTRYWVQQGQMLCCAASAVIAMNSVQLEAEYTQDDLFVAETADIITLDEFQDGQATLDKVTDLIRVRSGLTATAIHAGDGPGEGDLAAFRQQVQQNATNVGDYMIVNYSLGYLAGLGEGGGHCSPVAAYDEQEDLVLLLDPRGHSRWAWLPLAGVYEAMNTTDDVSAAHRGWVMVMR